MSSERQLVQLLGAEEIKKSKKTELAGRFRGSWIRASPPLELRFDSEGINKQEIVRLRQQ